MKLADKIIRERKKKGWSQEELAERLDVSRQSVSKWEGGLSVPELDKIIAMSDLFGVSTDYLLKATDDGEKEEKSPENVPASNGERIPRALDENYVEGYLSLVRNSAVRIAVGVMLCILSPITLILLGGISDLYGVPTENLSVCIGMLALLLLIGAALVLFIPTGLALSVYDALEKEPFSLRTETELRVRALYEAYAPRHRFCVTVGVLLCVLGIVPLLTVSILTQNELISILSIGFLLLCVSIGVAVLVRSSNVNEAYEKLLRIGEYSKFRHSFGNLIDSMYWGLTTVLYLVLSFLTGAWGVTWIIWVLAGVLSPLIEIWTGKRENS